VKRGFKSWCEKLSEEYRNELGLNHADPLDPYALAEFLGVRIRRPEDIPGVPQDALDQLLRHDPKSWSAITLCLDGMGELIILNSSHSQPRQRSSTMHELSHLLIGHVAARVDVSEDGCMLLNSYDKEQEDEANWLAGVLLVPRAAAMKIAASKAERGAAAHTYGVSTEMLEWRLNATGVKQQLQRRRALQ
jgi:hypothetical protein